MAQGQIEPGDLFKTGPFEVTGGRYVIAKNTGPLFGNTVVQCFPLSDGDRKVAPEGVAELIARLLNEELARRNI